MSATEQTSPPWLAGLENPDVDVPEWLRDTYAKADASDLDGHMEAFAEDAEIRVAKRDPIVGKKAIVEEMTDYFNTRRCEHVFLNVWQNGDTYFVETAAKYFEKSGEVLWFPALTLIEVNEDGLIKSLRGYNWPTYPE